jgi:hypothetical protein
MGRSVQLDPVVVSGSQVDQPTRLLAVSGRGSISPTRPVVVGEGASMTTQGDGRGHVQRRVAVVLRTAVGNPWLSTAVFTGRTLNSHRCPLPFHNASLVGLVLVPVVVRRTDAKPCESNVGGRVGTADSGHGVEFNPEPVCRATLGPRSAPRRIDAGVGSAARRRCRPRWNRERPRRGRSASCFRRVRANR